jgi:thioesterase domain-containing protein
VSALAQEPQAADIEKYLHVRIPLSAAMGVRVASASAQRVELRAPLAPNVNHRETVFGGSAAAVATLAAWSLLHVRMRASHPQARLVIQRNTMLYEQPITGDFVAVCDGTDATQWRRFEAILERHGRARITLAATLFQESLRVGRFEGDFAAIDVRAGRPRS